MRIRGGMEQGDGAMERPAVAWRSMTAEDVQMLKVLICFMLCLTLVPISSVETRGSQN